MLVSHTSAPQSQPQDAGKIWLDDEGFYHVSINSFEGPEWARSLEAISALRHEKPLGIYFYWLWDLRELEDLHSSALSSLRYLAQTSPADTIHYNALLMQPGYISRLLRVIIQSISNMYSQFDQTEIFFEEEAALAWLRANQAAHQKD